MNGYYLAKSDGRKEGSLSKEQIVARLASGACSPSALVWCEGMSGWSPAGQVFAREVEAQRVAEEKEGKPMQSPPPLQDQHLTGEKVPAPESDSKYYVHAPGRDREGPFSENDIRKRMARGLCPQGSLVWREGMSSWEPVEKHFRPRSTSPSSVLETAREVAGLSKLEGFSFKSFFGEIFRRHSSQDAVNLFCCGTDRTTPSIHDVRATWPAPWVFSRMIAFCILLYWGFGWALSEFSNINLFPGLLFVGCFGIPFCVLILFFEMNIKRDVPFYEVVKYFLLGGLLSLICSLLLFRHMSFGNSPAWAAFAEEPGKLIATLLIVGEAYRRGNVLQGMLFGCAVGAGFAAFETAGYVYRFTGAYYNLLLTGSVFVENEVSLSALAPFIDRGMQFYQIGGAAFPMEVWNSNPRACLEYLASSLNPDSVLMMRALYTPLCHVIWTAITAGAYWHVMNLRRQEGLEAKDLVVGVGNRKVNLSIFGDKRFLMIAVVPVLLHAFWNSSLLTDFSYLRNVAIGAIGWVMVVLLIQIGINQVRREKEEALRQAGSTPCPMEDAEPGGEGKG